MKIDNQVDSSNGAMFTLEVASELSRRVNEMRNSGMTAGDFVAAIQRGSTNAGLPDTRIVNDRDVEIAEPNLSKPVQAGHLDARVMKRLAFDFLGAAREISESGEISSELAERLKKHVGAWNQGNFETPDFSALRIINNMLGMQNSPYRLQLREDSSQQAIAIAYPDRVWDLRVVNINTGDTTDFEKDFFRQSTRPKPDQQWLDP